ncbi:hypothetical protein PPERSA_10151 [Pseudocohnilembus persalinus]|uniref:Uncharacterized protein n=1 Tax=Pseudocohnilembus persalinus TaxID=266149 RepID=A0A0V0QLD5_PSEPJ|nr:hypothetical protein PPERSA_10151 [Pseudocohnilembus persalinus]|eukprot:KRX03070.1 hypothetical protein PPERSA_10151 [Pseudocohnilembus persalinus]
MLTDLQEEQKLNTQNQESDLEIYKQKIENLTKENEKYKDMSSKYQQIEQKIKELDAYQSSIISNNLELKTTLNSFNQENEQVFHQVEQMTLKNKFPDFQL